MGLIVKLTLWFTDLKAWWTSLWTKVPAPLQAWLAALEAFVWIGIVSAIVEYPFSDLNKEHGIRTFVAKVCLTALAATRVYIQKHPFRTVVAELVAKPDGTMEEVVYDQGKAAVDTKSNSQDEGKGNVGEVRQGDKKEDSSGKESGRPT
jgi:hypothetical protein